MTRRVDETTRPLLLDRIVAYALGNGIGSLSLRALAKDLDVSAGSLLYHFHSKEELTVEILKVVGERQRRLFGALQTPDAAEPRDMCRALWNAIGAPEARPLFRLFFELYGLALVDPARVPGFFPAAVENWLQLLAKSFVQGGMSLADARAHATVGLATFRGLLLDVCATNDDARVNRAVEIWSESWQ